MPNEKPQDVGLLAHRHVSWLFWCVEVGAVSNSCPHVKEELRAETDAYARGASRYAGLRCSTETTSCRAPAAALNVLAPSQSPKAAHRRVSAAVHALSHVSEKHAYSVKGLKAQAQLSVYQGGDTSVSALPLPYVARNVTRCRLKPIFGRQSKQFPR